MKKVMESKIIKEENNENESQQQQQPPPQQRTRSSKPMSGSKERCKTPDSPDACRLINQRAGTPPTQSSPARQQPPSSKGKESPVTNGSLSADSLTPPLALTVNLEANNATNAMNANPALSRPVIKVKRFLSTLIQFGNDIGQEVGERVRTLVFNLVSSNLSIEEFHHSLQDVTNFPLRPFVLPFLRTHLPLLQREIHGLARTNKQSTLQYVKMHDHIILDSTHSPTEPSDIFLSNDQHVVGIKRRISDSLSELNGVNGQDGADYSPPKRPSAQSALFLPNHQGLLLPNNTLQTGNSLFDYPPPGHNTLQPRAGLNSEELETRQRGDEEWRNIHVMLNCILSMVEKTKRALLILQSRNNHDLTSEWLRKQEVGVDLKRAANEIMLQAVRQTEDRVAEVKRRAEEAVNDVKRQAVIELQKAVATAETKANELVAAERAKMDKMLSDVRKQNDDGNNQAECERNLSSPNSQPVTSQQNCCWNCGRKAHETCSGCSLARYCGSFCQHKDWENHHQVCAKQKLMPLRSNASAVASVTAVPATTTSSTTQQSVVVTVNQSGDVGGLKK